MMEITVRLGHGLAHEIGNTRLRVTLVEGATVSDLKEQIGVDQPTMAAQLAACVAIIAGCHVNPDQILSGDEEVALLMPISGGSINLAPSASPLPPSIQSADRSSTLKRRGIRGG